MIPDPTYKYYCTHHFTQVFVAVPTAAAVQGAVASAAPGAVVLTSGLSVSNLVFVFRL